MMMAVLAVWPHCSSSYHMHNMVVGSNVTMQLGRADTTSLAGCAF